jgi:S1-C subfamily serine protease
MVSKFLGIVCGDAGRGFQSLSRSPPSLAPCSAVSYHPSMNARPLLALMLLATVAHAQRGQNEGEEAFRAAGDWTVQVSTSVSRPFVEDEQGTWMGAGMLVDASRGWVLTNAHVAGHSYGKVSIAFKDGKAVPARRVYVDPYLDLAVLAYDPGRLRPKTDTPALDCASIPPVGHPVGAFGHPWGFRFTGTRGITSAVTTRLGPNMLQTDAPINEGNSGGPLISLETGQVVGINTAKIKEQSVEGLSFAVPMPYACTVLELLRQDRDPSPPARLVDFAVDDNDEQTMIVARSRLPAGTLDLRTGDVVLAVQSPTREVATETDLVDALRGRLDAVRLRVIRDGREVDVQGRWPSAARVTARNGAWISGALFAEADTLTNGLIAGSPALMVHYVSPGSDAESAGLVAYDLLMSVDRSQVDSLSTLLQRAHEAKSADRPLELMLLRLTSEDKDVLFTHQRRLLPVDELQKVGP